MTNKDNLLKFIKSIDDFVLVPQIMQ